MVNGNHEITSQKWKRNFFSPPPGFEPWSPETESQCATNELHLLLKLVNSIYYPILMYNSEVWQTDTMSRHWRIKCWFQSIRNRAKSGILYLKLFNSEDQSQTIDLDMNRIKIFTGSSPSVWQDIGLDQFHSGVKNWLNVLSVHQNPSSTSFQPLDGSPFWVLWVS